MCRSALDSSLLTGEDFDRYCRTIGGALSIRFWMLVHARLFIFASYACSSGAQWGNEEKRCALGLRICVTEGICM